MDVFYQKYFTNVKKLVIIINIYDRGAIIKSKFTEKSQFCEIS